MRAHDLRATFVTLALAAGRTETWVCDRTGHRSSQMVNRYRRAARSAAELRLGWLVPMDEAISEFLPAEPRPQLVTPLKSEDLTTEANHADHDAVGQTARDRLVGALTNAVRELLIAHDTASARIAIKALLELAGPSYAPDALSVAQQLPLGPEPQHASRGRVR
jgi:hypothetical protein